MIVNMDAIAYLKTLDDQCAQCCVTSPPFWGLRDYGVEGQFGLEPTLEEYTAKMVSVFREVRRVLRDDGTLWLNLGDSYSGGGHGGGGSYATDLRPKNLIGIPFRVAFALQADGWILRQDIIWAKPNPMPESVTDRCTKSHEYIFMFSRSSRYYYDAKAISEPAIYCDDDGIRNVYKDEKAYDGKHADKQRGHGRRHAGFNDGWDAMTKDEQCCALRNKRDVWVIATAPFKGAHFATFPPKLVKPCILAGCPEGGVVLDPFMGSGTTAVVAESLGRKWIGCDLNPDYCKIADERIEKETAKFSLFNRGK